MKKLVLRMLVMILGFIIGGVAGGALTLHRWLGAAAWERGFPVIGIVDCASRGEYDKNSAEAKPRLLLYLNLTEQALNASVFDPTMKKMFRLNRGLTLARLSVLESEAGNAGEANSYMSKAQEDLKSVGWLDLSEGTILQVVKRQPVASCGSSQNSTQARSTSPNP